MASAAWFSLAIGYISKADFRDVFFFLLLSFLAAAGLLALESVKWEIDSKDYLFLKPSLML